MKNSFLRFACAIFLVFFVAASVFAGGPRKKEPEYHDTVISSVTGNAITITQDKTPRTFPITQFTEITLKGQRATVADLQPGMGVSVTLGTDGVSASRIAAGDPPAHFATPKPVKPPKGFR